MNPIACYHWWSHPNQSAPYANLRTPIILSIATLRAVSDIPIIVFDMSGYDNEWLNFKDKLNFKVIRADFELRKYKNDILGWQYLSRIYDIHKNLSNSEYDTVMYVDTDVFWLKDPLPFQCDPDFFCFNGYNTGLYYYKPLSEFNQRMFDIFDCYSRTAIYSESFRNMMKKYIKYDEYYTGYDDWYEVWDELILMYMYRTHRYLFKEIPMTEHITVKDTELMLERGLQNDLKMFHCNSVIANNPIAKNDDEKKYCRGILCLVMEEFYKNLCKVLDQDDIDLIFTKAEQHHYLPKQLPFLDRLNLLYKSKEIYRQHYFK